MTTFETDYLVVGAGAMGMAFVDTLLTETADTDTTVTLIDDGHQPGGHWNRSYPFVRLHQPSAYYGVNSRPLGDDLVDTTGWNAGFLELATGNEVCSYYEQVLHHHLLPTDRLTYLPMARYLGHNRFRTLDGTEHSVVARRRVVDATYLRTEVPAMRPPPFAVGSGVHVVAPNDLPRHAPGHERFTIVGAGKTGIDVCLWLLRLGVAPERLRWIVPRDAWLMNRAGVQPGPGFRTSLVTATQAVFEANSLDDLLLRLEAKDNLLRVDPSVVPTMYHCAIVSLRELEHLRRIRDVVRMGRVLMVEADRMTLQDGDIATTADTLYVDCTAAGLSRPPAVPVFDGERITLQSLRGCQQVFSSALIARVETGYPDDDARNALCAPVPHPDVPLDWLRITLSDNLAQARWLQDPGLTAWLESARLNAVRGVFPELASEDTREATVTALTAAMAATNDRLSALMSTD
ncbi:NAD(P)/FAD-dependent oxidoreductase [Mycolicibacterium arenosum]|uniref:NAD(P)/FAD-dependent oxidoreductase n=1 Tax=Mycolicibacterium arenosum TaxID=2952157 RepID=A0ABT1M5M9_9MYCO|nr:NAD(P)/FAD-dependent oxidoreductase [Mycolicibacterium sp. CAU 1645]MCP9274132.1 NAD(P)/FAD-dependent oxidoreductase [Mycolicibacterium sp. CAU 1645]